MLAIDRVALERILKEFQNYASQEILIPFGRSFKSEKMLKPPYYAVKVTGALFHTQGGFKVNAHAQIQKPNGAAFENIVACGGAACGVSGPDVSGYLSGNGLLTALSLGEIAGCFAGGRV